MAPVRHDPLVQLVIDPGRMLPEKFNVIRRALRDELAQHPLVGADTRYAHVALVSDDAAEHVLTIGREQNESDR
jgi:hypothetical protein